MPENWKTYQFVNAPLTILDGDRGKNYPKSNEFKTKGHCLFLSAKNVTKTGFQFSEKFFISKERDELLGKGKLEKYDLVLTTRGTVGNVAYYGNGVPFEHIRINSGMVVLRVNKEALEDKFLYFFLRSPYFENQVLSNQTGSAQPQLPIRDLKTLKIKLPPLPEQKSIASILSALDDKIELNLQMNKTLEEMAMALYKHWFVDFGPFQDGEFVDSELGEIPKGWEVLSLSDVTSKITDGAHHSPKSVEEGKPMASVKDMDHWGFNIETCRKISEEDYLKLTNQGCRPLKNDVVIAKDGSYLKHAFVIEKDLDIVLLSSIAILKPNEKLNPHLLNLNLKLDSVKTRMKAIVSGAAIQRIVLKEFRKFLIIVPPKHIQDFALQSIENLMEKCWNNNSENQTLTQLRDTLLPKLISGEVRVKEVEKIVTAVL